MLTCRLNATFRTSSLLESDSRLPEGGKREALQMPHGSIKSGSHADSNCSMAPAERHMQVAPRQKTHLVALKQVHEAIAALSKQEV